jgi:hypothetical protein
LVSGRFSILLLTLALMFFVLPIIPADRILLEKEIGIFGLVVLISCLRAISVSRRFFYFMLAFSLVNVVAGSTELLKLYEADWFKTAALMLRLTYYAAVFCSIMGYVFDNSAVTFDKICGAISAYILMGIAWSVAYALFQHVQPGSFILPDEMVSDSLVGTWALYFSFTTLTTLGYGDITPQLPAVQTYAYAEAACGQIFLAVIIARLVALQIIHGSKKEGSD